MTKKFLVTGHWHDKATGKPVSNIAEISGGVNAKGQPYEIANTDSREKVDGTHPVGTVLSGSMNLSVQKPASS